MHCTSRITGLCMVSIASCALIAEPRAGADQTSAAGSAVPAAKASTGTTASHSSGGSLLCAGLLGSGILGDVLTVAPMVSASRSDPNTAIQFGPIWSATHEATVDDPPSAKLPQGRPAVAFVKLPISFSQADRQKFAAAGWTLREPADGHGISYCLHRAAPDNRDATSASQGMICVTGVP